MEAACSRSLVCMKIWPQKCTNDGRAIEPMTPLASMSFTREWMS
jgi:hypothetical protein